MGGILWGGVDLEFWFKAKVVLDFVERGYSPFRFDF